MSKATDFTDFSVPSLIGFNHPSLSTSFSIAPGFVNLQKFDIETSVVDSRLETRGPNLGIDLTRKVDYLNEKYVALADGMDRTEKKWQDFLQKDLASNNGLRPVAGDLISFDRLVPPLYQPITLASKMSVLTVVKND